MKFISTIIILLFSSALIGQNLLPEVVVVGNSAKVQTRQTITREIREAAETDLEFPVKKKSHVNIPQGGCYLCCAPARSKDTVKTLAFKLPVFYSNGNNNTISNCKIPVDTLNKIRNELASRSGCGLVRSAAKVACRPVRLRCAVKIPEPLYVVNGEYFSSIECINPDNIEDITDLESPAAQAIFGIIGQNGITVVTLKMKYDRITIKDIFDKTPISKATISFVFPERKDTLRYIADDSGVVVSNSLAKLRGCEMIVTATGYKSEARVFYRLEQLSSGTIYLSRDIKLSEPVVISRIVCCRKISCGGRCWVRCRKKIVQIPVNDPSISFKIYPNPAKRGQVINFEFASKEEQLMKLRVLSLDGKTLFDQEVKAVKGINVLSVNTGINWAAGIYFVQILYENGRLAASGRIVVQ